MDLRDTQLVSQLRKVRAGKADPAVATWADAVEASSLVLAAITLQEQELAVLRAERRNPTQGALLRHWLQQAVVPAFAGRLLAVDAAVARRSAARHGPGPQAVS